MNKYDMQELTLKISNLTDEEQRKKKQLGNETMNTHTKQVFIKYAYEQFKYLLTNL